jgi:hypothetical protein
VCFLVSVNIVSKQFIGYNGFGKSAAQVHRRAVDGSACAGYLRAGERDGPRNINAYDLLLSS